MGEKYTSFAVVAVVVVVVVVVVEAFAKELLVSF